MIPHLRTDGQLLSVKLDTTVRRLLLVAADDSVETDLLEALKRSEVVQKFDGVFSARVFLSTT